MKKTVFSFIATLTLSAITTSSIQAETTTAHKEDTKNVAIHDIQGAGHKSPYNNKKVENVEGIVTYKYKLNGANYLHIQTPDNKKDNNPNTSEGLIIYTGKQDYNTKVGDLVKVTGTVDEYYIDGYNEKKKTDLSVTQINARDDKGGKISIESSNQQLPKPYKIKKVPSQISANDQFNTFDRKRYAVDYWESLEGMRVETGDVRSVGPQEHGEVFTVLKNQSSETDNGGVRLAESNQHGERIPFKMYDNNTARDFNVATGDYFKGPIIGYVNYGYSNYKVNVDLDDMKKAHVKGDAQPKPTSLEPNKQKLNIASYNLENFSNNPQSTTEDKAEKIAKGITTNMKSPDIIGVTEVQDNDGPNSGGPEANESYERLIKKIQEAGGPKYKYLNIDPEMNEDGGQPNANIRVGFLYNPKRVHYDKSIKPGDADTAVSYKDGNLTRNPGRIDPHNPAFDDSRKPLAAQFKFHGEQVIILANHWNSKNGDMPLFGSQQPPALQSENQRTEIAKAVGRFVDQVQKDNPQANIISVGDYNDFQWSKPIKTLESFNMTDMMNKVPEKDRYSYVYQGNSQALDHVLVSNNLADATKLDSVHVNSDFTDMSGRASDHDPLVAQIDLKKDKKDK
ncbi:endonuclease [Staphylococcus gallinarum]|uniref:Endonuclease n=1 Tax=Staphylococcus gallinarum TaxID=1293 RepID=A0A3A0VQM2_STAGA|nr:endonuclease/exonuclease/phosphatase family protein [Staphylococcus gallinarum]RIP35011.1 endonuclease [Staphylococcus gallinarum]